MWVILEYKLGGIYKVKKMVLSLLIMVFALAFVLPESSQAAIADGTYSVNYQVNKPGSKSASMANDYFLKPAKVIVKNGKMTVQVTIKNSAWVTAFNPPGGAKVISKNEAADQRVVQFNVSSISSPTTVAMKIDINDIDYHHSYSVDFVFDGSSVPDAQATGTTTKNPSNNNNTNGSTNAGDTSASTNNGPASSTDQATERVENPQTSDSMPYVFIIALLLSAFFFIRTKQTN